MRDGSADVANLPETRLDQRYSDADSKATSWEETVRILEEAQLFWLTTVRSDGRPHATPLVAVWMEGALHFTTGAEEQKAINLQDNDQVLLTTGCARWESGADVMLEGRATRVTDEAVLARLTEGWRPKWDGRWQFGVKDGCFVHAEGSGGVLVFRVVPSKVLVFGKGSFSHTTHRFEV